MLHSSSLARVRSLRRAAPPLLALPLLAMLGGCDAVVMNPAGDVAVQQRDLVLISTGLMLLIIIPVMILTCLFAWKYRAANRDADYDPHFDHSTPLELVIWAAPLLIIICLGAVTWTSTHLLDPYRPIERTAPGKKVAQGVRPLEVQVVSMDWKWLFIYPEQGIATVNQLALPVDRPVRFRLTGTGVMNAFYVPTMAGMIYTMPGMETALHAVINKPGTFDGFSSHYSGAGFSDMNFKVYAMQDGAFDQWVAGVKGGQGSLSRATFVQLEKPSEKVPPMRFAAVAPGLFDLVVNRCVEVGKPCMSDVMMHDRKAGGDPHKMEAGEGNPPVNDTGPMHGDGTKGALQKSPDEIETSPHQSKEPLPAPGNTDPGNAKNRRMTFTTTPRIPGTAGADRG
ncbi:ubiquinol oxidase subunit II [Sphingomonas sp.]|uniref:ubiquinol oxidase subunit II n=1 Tax=Sphingomonas sp. TaxID=28214 RepID=UPI0035B482C6